MIRLSLNNRKSFLFLQKAYRYQSDCLKINLYGSTNLFSLEFLDTYSSKTQRLLHIALCNAIVFSCIMLSSNHAEKLITYSLCEKISVSFSGISFAIKLLTEMSLSILFSPFNAVNILWIKSMPEWV